VFFREGYAQPSHDVIIIEALDGANRQAVAGYRKRDTRAGGLAVDQHGTSTADAMFTAEMRTRQPALFAQKVGKTGARLNQRHHWLRIDVDRDGDHELKT
jgi:hypothetical protein